MKIKELIKKLQEFDEDQKVYLQQLTEDHNNMYSISSKSVRETEVLDIDSNISDKIVVITIDNNIKNNK